MLIFNRKEGEAFFVGDVKVVVLGFRGKSIRLGIEAPKEVPVHRQEVYEEIQREKAEK